MSSANANKFATRCCRLTTDKGSAVTVWKVRNAVRSTTGWMQAPVNGELLVEVTAQNGEQVSFSTKCAVFEVRGEVVARGF